MKNIHILPTPNPSRLYLGKNGNFVFGIVKNSIQSRNDDFTNQNIYITNSEEIKEGDYCIDGDDIYGPFEKGDIATVKFIKIILTTDEQLIRYGVQPIDDDFLEWFVKNPSCEDVEVELHIGSLRWSDSKNTYKIIIPKEETLEDVAKKESKYLSDWENKQTWIDGFIEGAKWQQQRSYSEDEVKELLSKFHIATDGTKKFEEEWFEKFKKK